MIELGLDHKRSKLSEDHSVGSRVRIVFNAKELVDGLKKLGEALGEEPVFCARRLCVLSQLAEYKPFEARLSRGLALGQSLRRPPGGSLEGQFGLYGTAAGIELLAGSSFAVRFREEPFDHPTENEKKWAQSFLALWNFLDLAVRDLSTLNGTKYWEQSRTTLRTCNLLRALSSASATFAAFSSDGKRLAANCGAEVVSDIPGAFNNTSVIELSRTLVGFLRAAKVSSNPAAFKFASNAAGVPETWGEQLFIWGSVIVAVVHAYSRNLLTESEVYQLCDLPDVKALIETLSNKANHSYDVRYKAFSLWALTHLTADGCDASHSKSRDLAGFLSIPSRLELTEKQSKWLREEVERTCDELLETDYHLTDLHTPYHILFDDPDRLERYRDEYFVIPAVPVALDLVARYKPNWLLRPRLSRLLDELASASERRDQEGNLQLLPFQVGAYNGTVNSLYYRDAAIRISGAIDKRSGTRTFAVAVGWSLWDNMRGSPRGTIGVAIVFSVLLAVWPHKAVITTAALVVFTYPLWFGSLWTFALGFLFGLLEHLLAAYLESHQ